MQTKKIPPYSRETPFLYLEKRLGNWKKTMKLVYRDEGENEGQNMLSNKGTEVSVCLQKQAGK